jgi:hypothetical protein
MKGYYSSSRKCRKCPRKKPLEVILTICFVVVVGKKTDFYVPIYPNYLNRFFFADRVCYHLLHSW